MKERALASMQDPDTASRRLRASDSLPEVLKSIRLQEVTVRQRQAVSEWIRVLGFHGLLMTEVCS